MPRSSPLALLILLLLLALIALAFLPLSANAASLSRQRARGWKRQRVTGFTVPTRIRSKAELARRSVSARDQTAASSHGALKGSLKTSG